MTELRVEEHVDAPVEAVWALVSDPTRYAEWSPENSGARWVRGASGPAVGARFRGANRNGWRRWSTDCRVVECDAPRRFAFDVSSVGIPVARWAYEVEPADGGGAVVRELWFDRRPRWFVTVSGWIVGVSDRVAANRAGMAATLAGVRAAAESRA